MGPVTTIAEAKLDVLKLMKDSLVHELVVQVPMHYPEPVTLLAKPSVVMEEGHRKQIAKSINQRSDLLK